MDSTHVKAHRRSAGGKGGCKRRPSGAPEAAEYPVEYQTPLEELF